MLKYLFAMAVSGLLGVGIGYFIAVTQRLLENLDEPDEEP